MKDEVFGIKDVADQAGVSKSTVSRILNNRYGNRFSVKEEVRQRVIEVARKLNYRPNVIAKSLTMGSTQTVHIFGGSHALADFGNIYQTVVKYFTRVIDSDFPDYDVTVDMSRHAPDASALPTWRIDGALILAKTTEKTMNQIIQMGIPYVVVNGPCPQDGFSVVPDDVQGTRQAIDYLKDLGHSKIVYAGPLPPYLSGHSSLRDRHETYLSQMSHHGLQPVSTSQANLDSPIDFLSEVVLEKKATAILAYGHMGALNLLQSAHLLDIAVPQKLSIICFCDRYANQVMSPGLTYVDLGSEKMGKIAAESLMDQIQNPDRVKPRKITVEEKILARNTTAPPGF